MADVTGAQGQSTASVSSLINNDFPVVYSDTKLEDLIPITVATDAPMPVVDGANKLVGTVDRASVMMAVRGKERPPTHSALPSVAGQAVDR